MIVVSDHGMLSVCTSRSINLQPLSSSIPSFSPEWMDGLGGAQVGLFPPPDVTPAAMLAEIQVSGLLTVLFRFPHLSFSASISSNQKGI